MPFDFFNPSNSAFGNKLTAAFRQLEGLAEEATNNITNSIADLSTFSQYLNRNYQVPAPDRADAACRVNELMNIADDGDLIREIKYSGGKVIATVAIHTKASGRITIASGETTLTSGYAYTRLSVSNKSTGAQILFASSAGQTSGVVLFKYSISSGNVIIDSSYSNYFNFVAVS